MITIVGLALLGALAWYMTEPAERAQVWRMARGYVSGLLGLLARYRCPPSPLDVILREKSRALVVTPVLAFTPVLIFMAILTSRTAGDADVLLNWGASLGTRTTNGEWWRLVTSPFVHDGLLPLVVNVAAIVSVGRLLERLVGPVAFGTAFMASALMAGLAALTVAPTALTHGATAGVCGLYGLLIATWMWGTLERATATVRMARVARLAPAAAVFVLYHGGGTWTFAAPEQLGAGVGFFAGLALTRRVADARPTWRPIAATLGASVMIAALASVPLRGMSDIGPQLASLVALESRHTRSYEAVLREVNLARAPRRAAIEEIETQILPDLARAGAALGALHRLPREHVPLRALAEEYVRLREESWRLRAAGNARSSAAVLRQADEHERAALQVLRQLQR